MIHSAYIHLILLPLVPIFFYEMHYDRFSGHYSIPIIGVIITVVATSFALWCLLSFLQKNKTIVAIITSILLIWFFSYQYLYNAIHPFLVFHNVILGRDRFLLPLYFCLLLVAFMILGILLKKDSNRTIKISSWLSALALAIFLVFTLSEVKVHISAHSNTHFDILPTSGNVSVPTASSDNIVKPDVYYIICDAYPSSSGLIRFCNFDNHDFLTELEKRGFYLPESSTSNYPFTQLSFASFLNMEYLENPTQRTMGPQKYYSVLNDLIANNRIMHVFEENHYHSIKIGSWWKSDHPGFSTYCVQYLSLLMDILNKSVLKPYIESSGVNNQQRVLFFTTLDKLEKAIKEKQYPKFVFAHIYCPHPPFCFQANGEKPPLNMLLSKDQPHQGFLLREQVKYLNKVLLATIDTILSNSRVEPIIILQGDHGAAFVFSTIMDTKTMPDSTFLKYQFRILNAYKAPEQIKRQLYNKITPVNSFRIIVSTLFGCKLDRLPDKNYYASHINPCKHWEVNSIVQNQ